MGSRRLSRGCLSLSCSSRVPPPALLCTRRTAALRTTRSSTAPSGCPLVNSSARTALRCRCIDSSCTVPLGTRKWSASHPPLLMAGTARMRLPVGSLRSRRTHGSCKLPLAGSARSQDYTPRSARHRVSISRSCTPRNGCLRLAPRLARTARTTSRHRIPADSTQPHIRRLSQPSSGAN